MNAEEFLVSINSKTKANLTMNRYTISGMFFYYTTQSKSISRLKQLKECKYDGLFMLKAFGAPEIRPNKKLQ